MLASLLTSVILLDCAAMQTPQPQKARTLEQLLATDKPAWPELQKWLAEARNHVEVIPPPNRERREAALVGVNVTTRSMLGAITYETGGILIDHGWVRHLGAESERLGRSIARWNNDCLGPSPDKPPRYVLVADDVIGGFFAQFPKEGGGVSMRYFAPDTLETRQRREQERGSTRQCRNVFLPALPAPIFVELRHVAIQQPMHELAVSHAEVLPLESADKDGSEASASPSLSARVASDGDQRVVWFEVGDAKRHREGDYLRICLMLVRGDRSVARLPEAGMLAIEWRD